MADEAIGALSPEKIKEYAASTSRIASAIGALVKHDGWIVFMALYERRKKEIRAKDDYASLEEFKADRKAIDIVDGILDTFEGYIKDAGEAAELLQGLSTEPPVNRGIMLIEQAEGGGNMEG